MENFDFLTKIDWKIKVIKILLSDTYVGDAFYLQNRRCCSRGGDRWSLPRPSWDFEFGWFESDSRLRV